MWHGPPMINWEYAWPGALTCSIFVHMPFSPFAKLPLPCCFQDPSAWKQWDPTATSRCPSTPAAISLVVHSVRWTKAVLGISAPSIAALCRHDRWFGPNIWRWEVELVVTLGNLASKSMPGHCMFDPMGCEKQWKNHDKFVRVQKCVFVFFGCFYMSRDLRKMISFVETCGYDLLPYATACLFVTSSRMFCMLPPMSWDLSRGQLPQRLQNSILCGSRGYIISCCAIVTPLMFFS